MSEDTTVVRRPKNIVILSDGTGQRGGVFFDEARTNIYKLYRATRSGPDSSIDPALQVAFYDPGLGTQSLGGSSVTRFFRRIFNFLSQATGLGITRNIIECYAAIIRLWEPGDRIYLFGFSRGAYTVRCLASVICYCGIPTHEKGVPTLRRDVATTTKIASRAVKQVYQHVSSPRDAQFQGQRVALGKKFRKDYGSGDDKGPNEYPFFIGVFDTVAALTNLGSLAVVFCVYAALLAAASFALSYVSESQGYWAFWLFISTGGFLFFIYLVTHLKYAFGLEKYWWWETVHLTRLRQEFYDTSLNTAIKYSRHAISIDERRKDFKRVPWSNSESFDVPYKIDRFQQYWFAGNHADIGGGYGEDESRLSDTAFQWMLEATGKLGDERLLIDERVLNVSPSPDGKQHDETRSFLFSLAGKTDRDPVKNATLHPSVEERFKLDKVLQYDVMAAYRPEALRSHYAVKRYYDDVPLPRTTCWQDIKKWFRGLRETQRRLRSQRMIERVGAMNARIGLDKVLSCLGLFFFVLGVTLCVGIVAYQVVVWLMTADWPSLPLSRVAYWLQYVLSDWKGLQLIVSLLLVLPLSLASALIGALLFWILGAWSAQLYKTSATKRGQEATPSQVQA